MYQRPTHNSRHISVNYTDGRYISQYPSQAIHYTLLYVPSLDKVCNMYICITLIKQGYVLNICYYIVYSDSSVGWIGVAGVYSLFLLSVIINKTLLNPVVNKVISREQWEGDFR